MKTSVSAAVAIGAALTSSPLSAASLTIPMAFEFIALNGQMIERSLVMRKDELQFAPGHHEIALRYSDMIESDFNDTPESIRSAAFIITLDASDDGDYVLVPAGGEVIRNPREFAAAPEVVITDEDGAAAKFTLTRTDVTRDFAASLYGNETRVGSDESPPAPAPSASADVVENVSGKAPAAAPLPIDTAGASPADMLQLWWRRADEKTRKEFLGWAIDQL